MYITFFLTLEQGKFYEKFFIFVGSAVCRRMLL